MPTDSPAAKQLKALRGRISKLSVRKLSAALGMSHTSYAYYEDDFKHRHLPMDLVKKLAAEFVGKGEPPITHAEVMALGGVEPSLVNVTYADVERLMQPAVEALPGPAMPPVSSLPIDVPVLGTAVGGSVGDFSLNGQIMDYVRRPPGVARNRNIFCIFLSGESMHPRLEHGELLYINPNRPARPGEDVLVEMHPARPAEPGVAYVKQLEAKTPTKLILKQFNPPGKLELPLAKVLRISPIMRNKELMGV